MTTVANRGMHLDEPLRVSDHANHRGRYTAETTNLSPRKAVEEAGQGRQVRFSAHTVGVIVTSAPNRVKLPRLPRLLEKGLLALIGTTSSLSPCKNKTGAVKEEILERESNWARMIRRTKPPRQDWVCLSRHRTNQAADPGFRAGRASRSTARSPWRLLVSCHGPWSRRTAESDQEARAGSRAPHWPGP